MKDKLKKKGCWAAFIVYADLESQMKLIKKLKPAIRKFRHFNYNYYDEPQFSMPHVSIRVDGSKKERSALKRKIERLGYRYEVKDYYASERKAYEFGSRCAFIYDDLRSYFFEDDMLDKKRFLFCALHGFLDDIGVGEGEEGRLHLKLAWHFLVKKPFYKWKYRWFRRKKYITAPQIYTLLEFQHEIIGDILEAVKHGVKRRIENAERINMLIDSIKELAEGQKFIYDLLEKKEKRVKK